MTLAHRATLFVSCMAGPNLPRIRMSVCAVPHVGLNGEKASGFLLKFIFLITLKIALKRRVLQKCYASFLPSPLLGIAVPALGVGQGELEGKVHPDAALQALWLGAVGEVASSFQAIQSQIAVFYGHIV